MLSQMVDSGQWTHTDVLFHYISLFHFIVYFIGMEQTASW